MIGRTAVMKAQYGRSKRIWLLAESLQVYSAPRENQEQTGEYSSIAEKKLFVAQIK
jgi:hypothetical protein